MELSKNIKTYRVTFYSDKNISSKYLDVSEDQRNFILKAMSHYKDTGENIPLTIGELSFAVSNIKMIDKIKDDSKLNELYRESYNSKNKATKEEKKMTVEESRAWAKQLGVNNTAWECGDYDCGLWNPYLILKDPETGNPIADFICKHCGK